jgi:protein SCO1/2
MRRLFSLAVALLWCAVASASVTAPHDLERRAGFDQHIGTRVPMAAQVTDAQGRTQSLATIADGTPLLIAFGYYRCPNLCDLTLQGMAKAVATMSLNPARDYRVVFISIDPHETPADARKAQGMLAAMAPSAQLRQWTFATATAPVIATLTNAVGFRYFFDARNAQFAHPAGLVVVTPAGQVAQYFFGVGYEPAALRLALVNASGGHLGNIIDRLVLLCCGYDPATGRYSVLVSRIMIMLGCSFVALMLAGGMFMRRRFR